MANTLKCFGRARSNGSTPVELVPAVAFIRQISVIVIQKVWYTGTYYLAIHRQKVADGDTCDDNNTVYRLQSTAAYERTEVLRGLVLGVNEKMMIVAEPGSSASFNVEAYGIEVA